MDGQDYITFCITLVLSVTVYSYIIAPQSLKDFSMSGILTQLCRTICTDKSGERYVSTSLQPTLSTSSLAFQQFSSYLVLGNNLILNFIGIGPIAWGSWTSEILVCFFYFSLKLLGPLFLSVGLNFFG